MNSVFRLAQVTYNWNDPNPRNLIFTDQLVGYSVRLETSGACTTDASGNGVVTVNHNFGYAPWVDVFVTTKEGFYIGIVDQVTTWYGAESSRGVGDYLTEQFQYTVTATQVLISVNTGYTALGVGETPLSGQNYTFNIIVHMERIDA